MLRYTTGSIAIVILFYLGLALVGLGDDIRLGDREAPARALRLDGPERADARYLLEDEGKRPPTDPVAHFHLGNGAEVWRFNPFADLSANGRRQSFGLMDNYCYDRDRIGDRQAAHHGNHARAALDLLRATARRP